jgi:uncharacterized protein (TIGR02246 family)
VGANLLIEKENMRRLAFVVFIALSGCATASTPDANAIWKEYSASLNAGDLDRWLALWTEDGVQMPPDEAAVVGKDRIRARNRAVLDRFTFDIGITNEEVHSAGDLAFARGTYQATLTPKQGGAQIPINGKYMTILARQPDGSWKIHRDIFNSNGPAGK